MEISGSLLVQVIGMLLTAGAIYGGIRAEIRAAHDKADAAQKTADQANERLDAHLERGQK